MNKRTTCVALALLIALPTASYARDHRDGRDDYRRDYRNDYRNDYRGDRRAYGPYQRYEPPRYEHRDHLRINVAAPVRFVGQVIALPFQVGAAVIGAAVNVVTAPLYVRPYRAEPAYYDDGRGYDAPVGRVYAAPPEYYPPQPDYRGY